MSSTVRTIVDVLYRQHYGGCLQLLGQQWMSSTVRTTLDPITAVDATVTMSLLWMSSSARTTSITFGVVLTEAI